jgi:hypothetical protein
VFGVVHDAERALEVSYLYTADYAPVRRRLDQLTRLASGDGDRAVRSTLLSLQGMMLHYQAIDLDAAARAELDDSAENSLFVAALDAAGAGPGSEIPRARALFGLGLVEQVLRGDLATAAPLFEDALTLLEDVGAEPSLLRSEVVRHVGFDRVLRAGASATGIHLLTESLSIREQLSEPGWMSSGHTALSFVTRAAGRLPEAVAHAERAVEFAERLGLRTPHLEAARRQLDESRAALER